MQVPKSVKNLAPTTKTTVTALGVIVTLAGVIATSININEDAQKEIWKSHQLVIELQQELMEERGNLRVLIVELSTAVKIGSTEQIAEIVTDTVTDWNEKQAKIEAEAAKENEDAMLASDVVISNGSTTKDDDSMASTMSDAISNPEPMAMPMPMEPTVVNAATEAMEQSEESNQYNIPPVMEQRVYFKK